MMPTKNKSLRVNEGISESSLPLCPVCIEDTGSMSGNITQVGYLPTSNRVAIAYWKWREANVSPTVSESTLVVDWSD